MSFLLYIINNMSEIIKLFLKKELKWYSMVEL